MRKPFLLSVVLGIAAVAPAAADHVDKAGMRTFDQRMFHHRAKFTKAIALAPVPALTSTQPSRNTDGLSRNSDDCNDGCIDH